MTTISSEKQLRDTIGTPPSAVMVKKLSQLEAHSRRYISMCDLMAITCHRFDERIKLFSGKKSHLIIDDDKRFSITVEKTELDVDSFSAAKCGLYLLVAGFDESLRINGTLGVKDIGDTTITLQVVIEELYFHCGKSIKRSNFWGKETPIDNGKNNADMESNETGSIESFTEFAPFLLIATQNENGDMDLSPRGDPAGFVRAINTDKLLIPERPGNKIADSLTNILSNPRVAILLIAPGCHSTLLVEGTACLVSSKSLLADSAVQNEIPKLAIEIAIENYSLKDNIGLSKMNLWDKANYGDRSLFPSLGRIVSDQLQSTGKMPGKKSGLGRMLGKAAGSAGELLIQADYKKNLY